MSDIAVTPFVLQDVDLTIGTDNYEAHASTVQFVPTSSSVSWKGLKRGSSFTAPTSPTWALTLNYAQDWATANSLANYLMDHEGETVPVHFEPITGEQGFDADVIITPGAIGGDVDTVGVGSVSLGVSGAPVKSAA